MSRRPLFEREEGVAAFFIEYHRTTDSAEYRRFVYSHIHRQQHFKFTEGASVFVSAVFEAEYARFL